MASVCRRVGARLVFDVDEEFDGLLQMGVADLSPAAVEESFEVTFNGRPVDVKGLTLDHGGRGHVIRGGPGRYAVDYSATIVGHADPAPVRAIDRITYLRPSRYAESDRLTPTARSLFHSISDPAELLAAVSSWVGSHLTYVPGSSGPTSGAVDTLLQGEGVCRDYAHLTVALLRAMDVPARFVAVYAPGLWPMDYHAVVEALVGDRWSVVDATLLAPRSTLVRIATGRDAADGAFLSTYGGAVHLVESWVTAVVDGLLPPDDVRELVSLG